jgi:hypothetical protein
MSIPEMDPVEKAKQVLHKAFKLEGVSPFVAKNAAKLIADMFIEEHKLINSLEGVTYWKRVKSAVKKL